MKDCFSCEWILLDWISGEASRQSNPFGAEHIHKHQPTAGSDAPTLPGGLLRSSAHFPHVIGPARVSFGDGQQTVRPSMSLGLEPSSKTLTWPWQCRRRMRIMQFVWGRLYLNPRLQGRYSAAWR